MRRRAFIAMLLATTPGLPLVVHSESRRHWRIGLLASQSLGPIERLKARLRELGYVEGDNLSIDARFSAGRDDLYPSLAADLIARGVDMIVVWGTPAAIAAKSATGSIPIVLAGVGDVLNTGLVTDLAHPGGNVTGFSTMNVELETKRLELLKELIPSLSRVGILANPQNPLNRINIETARRAAALWGLSIDIAEAADISEVDSALSAIQRAKPDAVLLGSDTLLLSQRKKIVEFMADQRFPAIYPFREYAEAGGLMAHGANLGVMFERAASYVDRILKGTKPGELPIQQATMFELIINMKTAKPLGLTIPPSLLARADEVIE